ncbi:MAG: DegT/DnrJ/EryC1/StrS family aminotransferase [Dehalococcoidales bacterium]|nr:DegT/DnrJ/EryC1/StrS family aminotransferase [Dehalococcoidales bacterium]
MIAVSKGCLGAEELAAVKAAFELGYFGMASKVLEFEEAVRKYLGAKYVITTNNCTSALHVALDALGIGKGDEVITPSLTFIGAFQAISATGATPVPVDVYPDTLLIDIEDVKRKITPQTKAIMPVHYAGNPCDLDALAKITKDHKIRIIEDAAHAFGSYYKGKKIGSFGDIICFSFDSIKNITCGEGGAIICFDEALADILRQKRSCGMKRPGQGSSEWKERVPFVEVNMQGYRYHMSNINASIGLVQLKKIDSFIARRREICRRYDSALKNVPGITCLPINYDNVAPHIYVIRVKNGLRNKLMEYLRNLDIETGINYVPNHLHHFYARKNVSLPATEQAFQEILTIPLHCGLSDSDVDKVIHGIIGGIKDLAS